MERKKSMCFHRAKPENWNCAQAILKGFQQEFGVSDSEVEACRAYGGGRAEGGLCGALYMAERLLGEDSKKELEEAFARELGSVTCRELKRDKVDCLSCVRLADELVERMRDRR